MTTSVKTCFFVTAQFAGHLFYQIWEDNGKKVVKIKEVKGNKRAAMEEAKRLGYSWSLLEEIGA